MSTSVLGYERPMLFGMNNQEFLAVNPQLDARVAEVIAEVLEENGGSANWNALLEQVGDRTRAARDRIISIALTLTVFTEGWECEKRPDKSR